MRQVWSIANKELRGYFNSAVALIFLATFLSVALFTFFWAEGFWSQNAANVTPLFKWLPLLLIFLVAALTMRLWSEEHKTGTIEILLTLPVPIHLLVLGKFLAGLMLVALALSLTLGLPITVSLMGNLDWGPVVGGYIGALLLASAYLAIGLCVSSATENQIVALIGTAIVGALFYIPGVEAVAGWFGVEISEILRLIGTGSRFESIARGVLDLRDLAYYAALVALFLTLNTVLLEAKRWSSSEKTQGQRSGAKLAVALVALNALALNLWLQPVTAARVDVTEDQMYSLSDPTKELLGSLDETLVLRGYFSEETHPLLVPMVPEIRNMLAEYKIMGGDKVDLQFVDPSKDEALEAEALDKYGIRPTPFQFAGRHQQSIVNAYFQVLIAYGDQYEVLSVGDLIEVESVTLGDINVYVDNLEYEITKNIRKVVYGFQSVESLFASMPGQIELSAYVTPNKLPMQWRELPATLDALAAEFESKSNGRFTYQRLNPDDEGNQRQLFEAHGIRPFAASLVADDYFYFHLVLKLDDRVELIPLPEEPSENSLRIALRGTIERLAPGFTRVVGMVVPKAPPAPNPQGAPQQQQPPLPPQNFDTLRRRLGETYIVRTVNPERGTIPDDIDVLLVAGPDNLDRPSQQAIDQFLMRGGAVVLLVGKYRIDFDAPPTSIALETVDPGLSKLLEQYGVEVAASLVLDEDNDVFPMPSVRKVGGSTRREIERLDYPFFVRVSEDGMEQGGLITSNLGPVIMHWSSPVSVTEAGAEGREVTELLHSTGDAWLRTDTSAQPDFATYPRGLFTVPGFGPPPTPDASAPGGAPPYTLAVAVSGTFDSAFAKSGDPLPGERGQASGDQASGDTAPAAPTQPPAAGASADAGPGATPNAAPSAPAEPAAGGTDELPEHQLERSPTDTRLVVVGSSSFVSDTAMLVSEQSGSPDVVNNMSFVQNAIDWAVGDTQLLSIRARGNTSRTLGDVPEAERSRWEAINYGIALLGLFAVVLIARVRRQGRIRKAQRIIGSVRHDSDATDKDNPLADKDASATEESS